MHRGWRSGFYLRREIRAAVVTKRATVDVFGAALGAIQSVAPWHLTPDTANEVAIRILAPLQKRNDKRR